MKNRWVGATLAAACLSWAGSASAQIAGTWQGTVGGASGKVRIVLQIRKDDSGSWQAVYSSNYRPPGGAQDPGQRFPALITWLDSISFASGAVWRRPEPTGARSSQTAATAKPPYSVLVNQWNSHFPFWKDPKCDEKCEFRGNLRQCRAAGASADETIHVSKEGSGSSG